MSILTRWFGAVILFVKRLYVLKRLFWPLAKELVEHGSDGVFTLDECHHILDVLANGRTEFRVWGGKNVS